MVYHAEDCFVKCDASELRRDFLKYATDPSNANEKLEAQAKEIGPVAITIMKLRKKEQKRGNKLLTSSS